MDAIIRIIHPTPKIKFLRQPPYEWPEPHALYLAGNMEVVRLYYFVHGDCKTNGIKAIAMSGEQNHVAVAQIFEHFPKIL